MVFVYYHEEDVETDRIRIKDRKSLEKRLADFGWSNLQWCPADPINDPRVIEVLIGLPPNYRGEYGDYWEEAIQILCLPKEHHFYSGKMLVRDFLEGSVWDSPEGVGWGYKNKTDYIKKEN